MKMKDLQTKWFFITLALVGTLSFAISLLPFVLETFRPILREFAIAVFIAIILAITVERYASEKFQHEVDKALIQTREAVFEAVYATMMPEVILNEVREFILKQPFIRKNIITTISMSWLPDGNRDYLEFTTSTEYDVVNITNHQQIYNIYAQNSRPNDPKLNQHIKFMGLKIGKTFLNGSTDLEPLISSENTHISLRTKIELAPGSSEHIGIQDWRYIECDDYYTLNMGYPTDELTINVTHPKDIIVKVRVNHPDPSRLIILPGSDEYNGWKLPNGILPYQGLEIWWYPSERT